MTYVEWLRVRNCLRCVAIVLGILVVLGIVLRVSLARYTTPGTWVQHISLEPGTHASHAILSDGTKRTVLDNPTDRTHVVIDERRSAGTHIVITEPSKQARHDRMSFDFGSIHGRESTSGATTRFAVNTNGSVPMEYYMSLADIVALIVATMLAAPLAREIDGHLEIALTKPISRIRYALGAIGADVVGILAASLMTIVALYICQLIFVETPALDVSGVNGRAVVMGIALPVAWYALILAATTWLPRSYGVVLGFAWPVALVVGGLTLIEPSNVLSLFVHDVAWGLSRLDPLTYVSLSTGHAFSESSAYSATNFPLRLGIEVLLFIFYGALALLRWQRVEA